jgi:pyruvate kinase
MRKTKIVATIGPATESVGTLEKLIKSGVDVVRLNTKHNEVEWHRDMITRVREVARKLDKQIGIILDLEGPEIRIETYKGEKVKIKKGNLIRFVLHKPTSEGEIKVLYKEVIESLEKGCIVLIDNGGISFKVVEKSDSWLTLRALNSYEVGNRKSANFPNNPLNIPSISSRDKKFIDVAKEVPVDFIALSFVRTRDDVLILKRVLKAKGIGADVVSKIENQSALDNLTDIIKVSDAVMVARGDLGVEVPLEQIAFWQKKIVQECREYNKPVIVATQMLRSMVKNPSPTRAEATDIANAVFNGTDALMLSEETAIGEYPIEAVRAMARIAIFNEKKEFIDAFPMEINDATELIVGAAAHVVEKGNSFGLDTVIVFTESGYTAKALSSHRPEMRVIVATDKNDVANKLSMVYGIRPFVVDFPEGLVELDKLPIEKLKNEGIIKDGQTILAIHGRKWKEPGASSVVGFFKV